METSETWMFFNFDYLGKWLFIKLSRRTRKKETSSTKNIFAFLFPLFSIEIFTKISDEGGKMDTLYQNVAQGVCRRAHSFSEFSD